MNELESKYTCMSTASQYIRIVVNIEIRCDRVIVAIDCHYQIIILTKCGHAEIVGSGQKDYLTIG